MNAAAHRMLIVGAAVGYGLEQIQPFLASLERSGYRGGVALIVDRALARTLRASPWGGRLTLRIVRQWLPLRLRLFWGRRQRLLPLWDMPAAVLWLLLQVVRRAPAVWPGRAGLLETIVTWLQPPHQARFLHYRRLVEDTACTHVLLADVRDVVFQTDPLEALPAAGLGVSIEPRRYTLAAEPNNAAWLRLAYGEPILRELGHRPVSCSGVTCGDRQAMLRYLDAMVDEILALGLRASARPGLDQALHNALLWRGALGAVALLETLDSPVATLHGLSAAELRFDDRGRLLNRDGGPACILHMYDRVPGLRDRVLASLSA